MSRVITLSANDCKLHKLAVGLILLMCLLYLRSSKRCNITFLLSFLGQFDNHFLFRTVVEIYQNSVLLLHFCSSLQPTIENAAIPCLD
jgi:hypothetical protein